MEENELERAARLYIQNVIHLTQEAKRIAARTSPEVKELFAYVIREIQSLPTGSVERQIQYERLQGLMNTIFRVPSFEFASQLKEALDAESLKQLEWASSYINLQGGLTLPSDMAAAAVRAVSRTRVLKKSVTDAADFIEPLSSNRWKRIDKMIRTGFLTGVPNEQIARDMAAVYAADLRERRAIARTAFMSLAQEAHNEFWDANDDVIVLWRWDASMDYKVCPVCAPLAGTEKEKRSEFDEMPPIHPNCRCHVVPVTEAMLEMEREFGDGEEEMTMLVPKEGTDDWRRFQAMKKNATDVRYFKSPVYVTINGKRQKRERVSMSFPPKKNGKGMTMAEMILRAPHEMQAQILGSGKKAKTFREIARKPNPKGKPWGPEYALVKVTS